MSAVLPPPVLALSPGTLVGSGDQRQFLGALSEAVGGGLPGLLVREPRLHDRDLLALLGRCRALLGPESWLGVHDRPHLARSAGVQGVHLGHRSLPPDLARRCLPAGLALGSSAHAGDRPEDHGDADYLFLSPFGRVPGKGRPLGVEGLREGLRALGRPVWALGGLEPEDAEAVRGCGARGAAFLRGLLGAQRPGEAVRLALEAWDRGAGDR